MDPETIVCFEHLASRLRSTMKYTAEGSVMNSQGRCDHSAAVGRSGLMVYQMRVAMDANHASNIRRKNGHFSLVGLSALGEEVGFSILTSAPPAVAVAEISCTATTSRGAASSMVERIWPNVNEVVRRSGSDELAIREIKLKVRNPTLIARKESYDERSAS
jgi:hypothetical protein